MKILDKRWKMFLYGCAGIGINLLNLVVGSYLCSALLVGSFKPEDAVNQTFVGRDLVIAAAWAAFGVFAKIIDGVIDIPLASFTDRLKTKWGRRRPSLIIGLVLTVAFYAMFTIVPNPSGANWLNTIWFGVLLCLFYCAYTLTMVTYYATFTEIVDNEQDRAFISNVKSVCDIVYFIIGFVGVRMLLNGINVRYVALMVLPVALTMLIPIFMIKEKSTLDKDMPKEKTVNLFKSLGYTLKNKDFIFWMIVYSFMTFGVQLFLNGINEYFSFTGMNMILVMLAAFVPVPFTLMLYNAIVRKRGFRFGFRYVLLMFSLSMLGMFGVSYLESGTLKTVLAVLCGLLCSLSIGALFSVAYSIPSQLAADDEKRTGISHSAMYFAVQGLFAGVASGIGGAAVLTALKEYSKNGGVAMQYMTLIVATACAVAFLFTFILPTSIVNFGKMKKEETPTEEDKEE